MQDEVNTKVVAIMIKGGKISAEVLKKALDKFVQEIEKAQKQMQQPKTYRGKQSIKHLMSQNAAISNIEVTDGNIKSFERTASKYGLDFALKKDVSVEPPSYLVFFKGRDVDVMAFVPVPKDLNRVKTKVMFNLTKRQLICFSVAAAVGVPIFFLAKAHLDLSTAAMLMVVIMLPFIFFALYEKDGQPAEKYLYHIVQSTWKFSLTKIQIF